MTFGLAIGGSLATRKIQTPRLTPSVRAGYDHHVKHSGASAREANIGMMATLQSRIRRSGARPPLWPSIAKPIKVSSSRRYPTALTPADGGSRP